MTLRHSTNVVVADDGISPVGTDEWNADHVVATDFSPPTDDSATLGTTTKGWSDLHLAIGGTLNWANGNAHILSLTPTETLTHEAGTFQTIEFFTNNVRRALLGSGFKGVDNVLTIIGANTTDLEHHTHVATLNTSGGPWIIHTNTRHASNPFEHGELIDADYLGYYEFFGSHQLSWDGAGAFFCQIDGTVTPTAMPTMFGIGINKGADGYELDTFLLRSSGRHELRGYNKTNTNTVHHALMFEHKTDGTPAVGIGVGLEFRLETSASNIESVGSVDFVSTDVTPTSEDIDCVINLMAGGAAKAEKARITSTGVFRLVSATNPSPTNGDLWFDGTDLKFRTGGVTKTVTLV